MLLSFRPCFIQALVTWQGVGVLAKQGGKEMKLAHTPDDMQRHSGRLAHHTGTPAVLHRTLTLPRPHLLCSASLKLTPTPNTSPHLDAIGGPAPHLTGGVDVGLHLLAEPR